MEKRKNKKIIIKVSDLSKSFNNNIVLKNINFQLFEGESLAIIGASGSGKSVLLKNIIGILQPDKGSIEINDTQMVNLPRKLKEKILLDLGITFQHGALFDSLKNWENIIFKTANKEKTNNKQGKQLAFSIIKQLGLQPEILDLYPSEISGGMQKRVAIARAICGNPKILLFDEPTSALDPELEQEVIKVIKDLAQEGRTMIIVTHDMQLAGDVSDHVVFLHKGLIEEEGSPNSLFKSPKSERLQKFLSSTRAA